MLQQHVDSRGETGKGDDFLEHGEVNERVGKSGQQICDNIHEVLVYTENGSELPMNIELPMLTPLTEESGQNVKESGQNVDPQVISNPISDYSGETNVISKEPLILLENLTPRYPQRSNKGIPKKQYEPEPKAKVKYPINNYVSTHRLGELYAMVVNQLSNVSILRSLQDALADPKWTKAMNEEMEALHKRTPHGNLFLYPKERK